MQRCHLKTSAGCTFVNHFVDDWPGTEIALKMDGSLLVMNILFIVSFMLVLILAPRRTENYPVSEREYMKLKKESAGIVIGCWVLAIISPDVFGKMIANGGVNRGCNINTETSCIDMKNLHKCMILCTCIQKQVIVVTDNLCNIV